MPRDLVVIPVNGRAFVPRHAIAALVIGSIAFGCSETTGPRTADDGTEPSPGPPVSIEITGVRTLWERGETIALVVTLRDSNGVRAPGEHPISWASSDTDVARVSSTGLVTAVGMRSGRELISGSTHIMASSGALEDTAIVKFIDRRYPELFIAGALQTWWKAMQGGGAPSMGLSTAADEYSVSWGNFAGRDLSSEPRVAFDNSPGYTYAEHTTTLWFGAYRAMQEVSQGVDLLRYGDPSDDDRMMIFADFVIGLAHASLALVFDKALVVGEGVSMLSDSLPLMAYPDVWKEAERRLTAVIDASSRTTFTLPGDWINGNALSSGDLAKLAHAQLARWLPQMARTPAQRAAVDWTSVIGHVDDGITRDFTIEGDGADHWPNDYLYFGHIVTSTTWSRADYKTIGQYDVSGRYASWMAQPVANRTEFTMPNHPDARIVAPGDPTGTEDGSDFAYRGPSRFPSDRGTYHYSNYSGIRYDWWPATETGPMPYILTAELQLNKAEGLLRLGGSVTQQIVDIVNQTRVGRGGLPPLTTASSMAHVLDAIIYERRIETYGTCNGCAFFHRRSEGPFSPTEGFFGGGFDAFGNPIQHHQGLVEGTPGHFPIPGRELEAMQMPNYTFGGVGNELGPSGVPIAWVPATSVLSNGRMDASTEAALKKTGRPSDGLVRYRQ